jgi:hypothetical protein
LSWVVTARCGTSGIADGKVAPAKCGGLPVVGAGGPPWKASSPSAEGAQRTR